MVEVDAARLPFLVLPVDGRLHRRSYARRTGAERGFAAIKDPASNDISRGWCRLIGLTPLGRQRQPFYRRPPLTSSGNLPWGEIRESNPPCRVHSPAQSRDGNPTMSTP
jgi:hypothetical protein